MEQTRLVNFLRAGFTGFWMKTDDPYRVKSNVYPEVQTPFTLQNGEQRQFNVMEWDCLTDPNPMTPLNTLVGADDYTVMFLYNYHWFLDKPQIIQVISNLIPEWSNSSKSIVIVSPIQKIPVELKKCFTTINVPLPDENEIRQAMTFIAPDENQVPKGKKADELVRVSKGLTKRELDNIYSLSLVEMGGKFDVDVINRYRSVTVQQSGLADILSTDKNFETVIGYEVIKKDVMETIYHPDSQGIITIGPTGTGKTSLLQAIANESGKLAVKVRVGKLMSKYQGESDQNVESLIAMLTALGDCFVLFDEFEKQFSGVGGSGETDGGTSVRIGGQFLEFFEDTPKGIYRGATCNTFRGIPPEYFRPGRWDSAPWYVDLPSDKVKKSILNHYIKKFDLSKEQTAKVPAMPLWTGAEIEALCKKAWMREINLTDAVKSIMPMAQVAKEEIAAMREWAKGRTVQAEDMSNLPSLNGGKRKVSL